MSNLAFAKHGLKIEEGPGRSNAAGVDELRERNHRLERRIRELELRNRSLRRELDQQATEAKRFTPASSGLRLQGLRRVSGAISHLFNNLITCISCSSEMLRATLPPASQGHAHLDIVDQAWRRGTEICQRMQIAAGDAPYKAAELDLNSIVRQTVPAALQDRVRVDLDSEQLALKGDAVLLRQLAVELTANAVEAIGDGEGQVTISTGRQDYCVKDWRKPDSWARMSEPWLYLEVSDDGCGMEPAEVPKIFDPFFTTKFLGRGLGLCVALGIVEQHGGSIRVRSQVGQGSTFRVLLPARDRSLN